MSLYDEKNLQAFLKMILFLNSKDISIIVKRGIFITDFNPDTGD